MTATIESLLALDSQWTASGHHSLTPFWTETAAKLLSDPSARTLVARVGRGGAKSFTSAKFGVNEVLAGDWSVPPGERHFFAYVSRLKEEVSQRRLLLEAFLRALGVPFDTAGDEIALRDLPLGFRFFACSVAATSGFRCIGYVADEVAKWESTDTYRNPAAEVIASLNAMCVTHPAARQFLISSPWSTDDYHAERFDQGDTAAQVVVHAPSWLANPSITEEQTRALEPDARRWSREYLAEPGATVSAAIDVDDLQACYDRAPAGALAFGFVAIDASSLRGDGFTWLAGRTSTADELVVQEIGGWEGATLKSVTMGTIVETISKVAKRYGVRVVYGDQREEAALRALFHQQGVRLTSYAWSEPSKDDAMMLIRRTMRERKLLLPDHRELKRELVQMRARLMPSGRSKYETNGLDFASALLTLAHAVQAKDLKLDERRSRAYSLMRQRTANLRRYFQSRDDLMGLAPKDRGNTRSGF